MLKFSHSSFTFFLLYFLLLVGYSIFSYSLTDPNLILTGWAPYWNFQQTMWRTFFDQPTVLTQTYFAFIVLLFITYGLLLRSLWREHQTNKKAVLSFSPAAFLMAVSFLILPLFFSYNALSHDVFNYIFNAKMVHVYGEDPHQKVALDFANDEWVRFMHNTHTPAPYGYGWTVFSLLPYSIGMGKFLVTWLAFRAISIVSVVLCFATVYYLARVAKQEKIATQELNLVDLALLFFNPLFLIEIVSNSHNDLWMMVPAIFSLAVMMKSTRTSIGQELTTSIILFALSISIKYASLALLPLWGYFLIRKLAPQFMRSVPTSWTQQIETHYASIAAFLMFLPLLTDRSQQFHPWYLSWVLVWLPVIRFTYLRSILVVLSASSLLRYIPWLYAGGFPEGVLADQKRITWIPFIVISVVLGVWTFSNRKRKL